MIAVVGGYGQGLTMRVPRSPEAGETVSGGVLSSSHGGKGSNQAIAIRRLGGEALLASAVGDDEAGAAGRGLWSAEGVVDRVITIPGTRTMAGFILVEPSGENRICIADGALGGIRATHVEEALVELTSADTVLVSLEIPVDAAAAALVVGRRRGARTILNPAPAGEGSARLVAYADVLTPNRSELGALVGRSAPETEDELAECCRLLRVELGFGGILVVTLGADGVLVDDAEGRSRIPGLPVDVVDTTGAGDTFSAALAVLLAEGADVRTAARFASVAGALAVTRAEVIPALPSRADVESRLTPTGGDHP